jgi:hypothetical protein
VYVDVDVYVIVLQAAEWTRAGFSASFLVGDQENNICLSFELLRKIEKAPQLSAKGNEVNRTSIIVIGCWCRFLLNYVELTAVFIFFSEGSERRKEHSD